MLMGDNRKIVLLKANYPSLFPLPQLTSKDQEFLTQTLGSMKFKTQMCFVSNKDFYRYIFMYYLLSLGRYVSFECHNAYYFTEVFLGKFEDYRSLYDFNQEVLGITLGYNETSNVRTLDLITQLFEIRRAKDLKTLLCIKGSKEDLESTHKILHKYLTEMSIPIINLNKFRGVSKGEKVSESALSEKTPILPPTTVSSNNKMGVTVDKDGKVSNTL